MVQQCIDCDFSISISQLYWYCPQCHHHDSLRFHCCVKLFSCAQQPPCTTSSCLGAWLALINWLILLSVQLLLHAIASCVFLHIHWSNISLFADNYFPRDLDPNIYNRVCSFWLISNDFSHLMTWIDCISNWVLFFTFWALLPWLLLASLLIFSKHRMMLLSLSGPSSFIVSAAIAKNSVSLISHCLNDWTVSGLLLSNSHLLQSASIDSVVFFWTLIYKHPFPNYSSFPTSVRFMTILANRSVSFSTSLTFPEWIGQNWSSSSRFNAIFLLTPPYFFSNLSLAAWYAAG